MLLAIDVGNTNIVIGIVDSGKIKLLSRLVTNKNLTADEYAIKIINLLYINELEKNIIDSAIISSVVPAVSTPLKIAVEKLFGISPVMVSTGLELGFKIKMDSNVNLGSDLIVNATAALNEYKPPMVIIDMGTATTFSVIDEDGNYIGGPICPGVNISLDALSYQCAQLPHISIEKPDRVIAKNTVECMKSGVVLGSAAMIDGMIERIEEELSQKVTIVATGGVSGSIIEACKSEIIYDEDLLIKGLYLLYQKNIC